MASKYEAIAEQVYDCFNRGSADELDGLFAKDFVEHQELPGIAGNGIDVVKQFTQTWRSAFPDARFEMLGIVSEGDTCCVRLRMTGTHEGEFMGMPGTGRKFDVEAYDWVRFDKNGKIKEHWGVGEDMKMMTQLGAIPEQAGPIDLTQSERART
jgi:steroid delta-isomerase-like uncharacterized protein